MSTKLHINLSQGIIDVEGDPEMVREIYADFKGQLLISEPVSTQVNSNMSMAIIFDPRLANKIDPRMAA